MYRDRGYDDNMEKVFTDLKNYRPKQSYLEFKSEQHHFVDSGALNFISKAKATHKKYQAKLDRKK